MASGILCQACGIEAPTRYVEFHQNIGALVIRFRKSVKGHLCKRCIHKHFWKLTGTNLTLGWWGYISVFITPIFVVNNVVRYIGSIGLESVPPDAKVPSLMPDVLARLQPKTGQIFARLNQNEPLEQVARDVSRMTSATPGQVVKYVIAVAQQQRQPVQPPTFGFPVQPAMPLPALPAEEIPLEPIQ
jgi:hypothetical protein